MIIRRDEAGLRRLAYDAAIWGTPIVSFDAMRQAFFRDAEANYGDLTYLSRFADWRFQVTTPNASTRYVLAFFNTRDGPIVLEIPPATGAGLFGSILDAWQVPLADVGPQGSDAGRGGKYLLLPPDAPDEVPPGYLPVRASTHNLYAAFRAISEGASQAAVDRALDLVKAIRIYPLSQAANPPPTRAIDMAGKLFDGVMRYDITFFTSLARMVEEEPIQPLDTAMVEALDALGVAKGQPFAPDGAMQNLLADAAHTVQRHLIDEEMHEGERFWPDARWRTPSAVAATTGFSFVTEDGLDVAARAQVFFMACAPPKALGKASMYLGSYCDSDGRLLTGDHAYRLRVPPGAPADQFWALTVYDAETCAFLRNAQKVEVNSYQEGLAVNADGSIDILLSPEPPAGGEANWAALAPGRAWFAFLRFYGPRPALFDKSWRAPDFERLEPGGEAAKTHGWIRTETVRTRVGAFDFSNSYPAGDSATRLRETLVFNRAVEAYLTHMPTVSWLHVWRGTASAGAAAPNQVVIWDGLMDSASLLLTGNTETVYGLCSLDLKRDGPVVVEVPGAMLGGFIDLWQGSIADIGPTGVDKGKGGRFLVLPPDYGEREPKGYTVLRSPTYCCSIGLRGFQTKKGADPAVALLKTLQVYPLSQAKPKAQPQTVFFDASHQEIDTLFTDDARYFDDLAWIVEREPEAMFASHERFHLASLGIEKGRPHRPDAARRRLLDEAARLGSAVARANSFASEDPAARVYPDRRWEWAFIGGSATWDSQGYVNTDRRAAFAYIAIGMSPAMVEKHVGAGSQYLMTAHDSEGAFLDGGRSYRLRVPAKIPVKNFWSVVAYDADSRSILRNSQDFPTVSTYTGPDANRDGSIDIWFGPRAHTSGSKNWIQTTPGKGWFTLFRFYGPLEPFFDKSWKPGDIERTN
jgi:hypothetical protein